MATTPTPGGESPGTSGAAPATPDPTDPTTAAALDAADPLADFVDAFLPAPPGLVYLDGNSLGRPPRATAEALRQLADEWATELVRGWDRWLDLPATVGARIGRAVLGARADEVIVADSTTVNLYRLAHAALDARPERRAIVVATDEFPTDRYVLEGLARERRLELRWLEADPIDGPTVADIGKVLDETVALVVLSHVNYRSAAIADMPALTTLARDAGALVLWDLCHAVGAIPIDLDGAGVDLAVGCTYKYLNGGPGSPAFLYVRRERQAELHAPIQGWFAQRDQFAMGPRFDRSPGIRGWLGGTPPIPSLLAIDAGTALIESAGIDRVRAKSIALTEYAVALHDAWLAPLGFALGSPREAARRGSHVAIRRRDARQLADRLVASGTLVDFREPDSIRLGLSPLTTTFGDVHEGLRRTRDLARSTSG